MNGFSKIINKFALVKQIPIFSRLSWLELHTITRHCTLSEYKKGELICQEGNPPEAFYCLVTGRIQAYNKTSSGKKENVEYILRGMHFGIIALFTDENHAVNFEAINDSVVLKIPKDDFLKILKTIPHLAIEFSQSLSKRLRNKHTNAKSIYESTIISIYSPVKGSGSSTYAINLASSLSRETNRNVIFVTISSSQPHRVVTASVEEASPQWKKNPVNVRDVVDNPKRMLNSITKSDQNLSLLHVVFDHPDELIVGQISHFVSTLVNDYYYVVVDLPNDMDDIVLKTLTQSDLVQLITRNRQEDLRLTRGVIDDLQRKHKDHFRADRVQVLISSLESDEALTYPEMHEILKYNILTTLPFISRPELNKAVVSEVMTAIMPDDRSPYAKVVTRIARTIGGVLVGVVLGGGAALGVAHIGVIRVLEREHIPVDIIVGSSMGALIGALWGVGNNAKQLEAIAREFQQKKGMLKLLDLGGRAVLIALCYLAFLIFGFQFHSLGATILFLTVMFLSVILLVLPKSGFVSGTNIKKWLRKHLGSATFHDLKIPMKIVSYDLIRREEQVLDQGDLVDAVRESIGIPGVINPVMRGNKMIIDGGVLNPLPTNVLTQLGINRIIAINVLQSPADVSKGFELSQKEFEAKEKIPFMKAPLTSLGVRLTKHFSANIPDIIIRTLQASEYIIAEQSAHQADVVIHPDLTGINWFELYQVDRLIKSGEEAAVAHLSEIKKLVTQ